MSVIQKISPEAKLYVENAMKFIHSKETSSKFMDIITSKLKDSNSGDAVADTVLMVYDSLDAIAKGQGVEVTEPTKLEALPYIIDQVITTAEAANLIPDMNQKDIAMLISTVVTKYITIGLQTGKFTQEDMAALGSKMKEEMSRSKSGTDTIATEATTPTTPDTTTPAPQEVA